MQLPRTLRLVSRLLALALTASLGACAEPGGNGAESAAAASSGAPFARRAGEVRRVPESAALPVDLRDRLCSLRRGAREADLLRVFGAVTERHGSAQEGALALTWRSEGGSVFASFGASGTLELASARSTMKPMRGDTRLPAVDLSVLEPGNTSLDDVEALLGPGVLTQATWHKGLEIAPSDAVRRGLPADISEDRCEMLYTWLVPGRARPLTVAFDRHDQATPNAIAMLSSQ